MLNADYKLIARTWAKRIQEILPSIIQADQRGFVKGRYIGENIMDSITILHELENSSDEAVCIALDLYKAFNTVKWSYMFKVLDHYQFPNIVIKWMKIFYSNVELRTSNGLLLSEVFYPSRGVHQGCPLSPSLFVLTIELMASHIRNNSNIIGITIFEETKKITLFADDTILFSKHDRNSLEEIFQTLEEFGQLSGYTLNYSKTQLIPLGALRTSPEKITVTDLEWYMEGKFESLGIDLTIQSKNLVKENYPKLLPKIKNTLAYWTSKGLSLFGKSLVVKSLALSRLVYKSSMLLSLSQKFYKELDHIIYQFLWDSKKDKI